MPSVVVEGTRFRCCEPGTVLLLSSFQFALSGSPVLAIEICPDRIGMAAENAKVYGVQEKGEHLLFMTTQCLS